MSDLVKNPNCVFCHAKAQMLSDLDIHMSDRVFTRLLGLLYHGGCP